MPLVTQLLLLAGIRNESGLDKNRGHVGRFQHEQSGLLARSYGASWRPCSALCYLLPTSRLALNAAFCDRSSSTEASTSSLSSRDTPPTDAFSRRASCLAASSLAPSGQRVNRRPVGAPVSRPRPRESRQTDRLCGAAQSPCDRDGQRTYPCFASRTAFMPGSALIRLANSRLIRRATSFSRVRF